MPKLSSVLSFLQLLLFSLIVSLSSTLSFADETEIFAQNEATKVNANILFLLDASGSMNQTLSNSGGRSRMQVLKDTFREVLDNAPANVNIGLMHYANANLLPSYSWSAIKGVNFPVSPIDQQASSIIGSAASSDNLIDPPAGMPVRSFLADIVDGWQPAGYTPIVDSLYEAARYFRGESPVWGKHKAAYSWAAHPSSYTGNLTCTSQHQEECSPDWGTCNSTANLSSSACTTRKYSECCKWETASNGKQYCKNNNYSCKVSVKFCQHTICDSYSGNPVYKSPIEHSCQANYLVLMSDGKPEYPFWEGVTADGTARYPESVAPSQTYNVNVIPPMLPDMNNANFPVTVPNLASANCVDAPLGYKSGKCGPELTRFLATQDQSTAVAGKQVVNTFTVAFGMNDEPVGTNYLAQLATAEHGAYTADNPQELAAAFSEILADVQKNSLSFSSPSFVVDQSNLLSHENKVYMPVFDPSQTAIWSGNLRKFTVNDAGDMLGANGSSVLNTDGTLKIDAQDLWSTTSHGADVTIGGAANKLPLPANRILYTDAVGTNLVHISPATTSITASLLSPSDTLSSAHNLLPTSTNYPNLPAGTSCWGTYKDCNGVQHTVNGNPNTGRNCVNIAEVTTCPTPAISEEKRAQLLNFIRGYKDGDPNAGARNHLGDSLNSKAVVVDYGNGVVRVLLATNEGFLHSFDANSGVEKWAFMPAFLLKNANSFLDNPDNNKHIYGIDGTPMLARVDHNLNGIIELTPSQDYNHDGQINVEDADSVKLYFGLRRGGRMYYGLDISVADTPSVMWKISPQTATNGATDGFDELGETWSKPTLSRLRLADASAPQQSKLVQVLVFGGGYDPRKDAEDITERLPDQWGRDVFIVDANSGGLLWSLRKGGFGSAGAQTAVAGASSLRHSIPGDIRILDMDGNGALDRLYFSDTGGNVWRVDMDADVRDEDASTYYDYSKAKLTQLASLGGGTESLDHRKFFYEPDTAIRMQNGKPILTIALGSGYRTHPLNTTTALDRLYVLIDPDVYKMSEAPTLITDNNLMDVQSIEAGKTILDYPEMKGWYYEFEHHGEKALSPVLTLLDKVMFTTFSQSDAEGNPSIAQACQPATNTSRAYVLDVLQGKAVLNLDRSVDASADKFVVAGSNELLDTPQLIFGRLTGKDGNSSCQLGDCQQNIMVRIGKLKLPLLDLANTQHQVSTGYGQMIDITRLLPRMYWLDSTTEDESE
ncbi:PilC/PilY family type IV pilus protein [uncultured Thiothrix sp.]|uniref:PilC/PilY family type IV pilus protein n=1 Tax=uncultured Thiothrix sp. TaxID=223185 RepID=UPI002631F061|nr:PilC/PilY family type IV pilus protein [uncultured Thiothrix sp.]